jgi:hypothetical protein
MPRLGHDAGADAAPVVPVQQLIHPGVVVLRRPCLPFGLERAVGVAALERQPLVQELLFQIGVDDELAKGLERPIDDRSASVDARLQQNFMDLDDRGPALQRLRRQLQHRLRLADAGALPNANEQPHPVGQHVPFGQPIGVLRPRPRKVGIQFIGPGHAIGPPSTRGRPKHCVPSSAHGSPARGSSLDGPAASAQHAQAQEAASREMPLADGA